MKKLIYTAIIGLFIASCSKSGNKAAQETDSVPTDSILIKRLQALQANGQFAFGHHDDPAYGYRWAYEADSSDVKNVTGDYPAIFDWDLGLIEWGCDRQLDGVPFDFMTEQIKAHDARGGINSISWHLRNPVTKGNSWDTSAGDVVAEIIKEGSPLNDTIKTWISNVADYIGELKDDNGKRIPVIFRPWHEHTGDWFWWGNSYCTPDEFKALWKLTYDVFQQKGIDNVVWAYSPDKSNGQTEEEYMAKYPGDEYVDIVGADVYYFQDEEGNTDFPEWMHNTLDVATKVAKEHGKIVALTETGCEALPVTDWFTQVLYPNIKDYPIAYVVVWRNAMPEMKPDHFYVPYAGHPAAEDFVKFYELPQTVFLKDIQDK